MHYNILVCGVLIQVCMASIESVIPGPWVKHKLSLYRHDFKTSLMMIIIIIVVMMMMMMMIIINCHRVFTRWQWLFYMYKKYEIYEILSLKTVPESTLLG